MSQIVQGDNSADMPPPPVKRKRGRPRKDQSLKPAESAALTPGVEGVKEKKARKEKKIGNTKDNIIGQPVTGVVEAAFDAGYLLTVRVGNSDTHLRGVVFKPGHYVPVTAENDVAPHVPMIRRNEIFVPLVNQPRVHGHRRSREKSKHNGPLTSPTSEIVFSKDKYASTAPISVPPPGAKSTVVPVVLQPVGVVNGVPSYKDHDVQTVTPLATLPPDGSTSKGQNSGVSGQVLSSEPQTSHQVLPGSVESEKGSGGPPVVGQGEEAKSIKSSVVLLPDPHCSPKLPETHTENSKTLCKTSAEVSCAPEQVTGDVNEPFLTKFPQASHPHGLDQSPSLPEPLKNYGTGRMTELLQALQENMESQMPSAEDKAVNSGGISQEMQSTGTNCKDC